MMQRRRRKNRKKGLALVVLCSALALGSAVGLSAYFTDTGSATNTFTVGKVTIDIDEPSWTPSPDDITPNQTFDKDPTITNTGDNDAFVFMTVEVPCESVITANLDGTRNAKALTDLFSYEINSSWTRLNTENVSETTATGTTVVAHKYTYVYGTSTKCTALSPNSKTTLFDEVTFANIVEGQLEDETYDMDIHAYGIQTTDLGESDTTVPSEVLQIICNQAE